MKRKAAGSGQPLFQEGLFAGKRQVIAGAMVTIWAEAPLWAMGWKKMGIEVGEKKD